MLKGIPQPLPRSWVDASDVTMMAVSKADSPTTISTKLWDARILLSATLDCYAVGAQCLAKHAAQSMATSHHQVFSKLLICEIWGCLGKRFGCKRRLLVRVLHTNSWVLCQEVPFWGYRESTFQFFGSQHYVFDSQITTFNTKIQTASSIV